MEAPALGQQFAPEGGCDLRRAHIRVTCPWEDHSLWNWLCEKFVEDCVPWEGHYGAAGVFPEKEIVAET